MCKRAAWHLPELLECDLQSLIFVFGAPSLTRKITLESDIFLCYMAELDFMRFFWFSVHLALFRYTEMDGWIDIPSKVLHGLHC